MHSWRSHATSRSAAVLAALGVASASVFVSPFERSEQAVADELGRAASAIVAPSDFVWGETSGVLRDLVVGREVYFLGIPAGSAARDAHVARVHLTPGGRPLLARDARALLVTEEADESDLRADGAWVAFLSRRVGSNRAESVSWLRTDQPMGAQVPIEAPIEGALLEIDAERVLVGGPTERVLVFDPRGAADDTVARRVIEVGPVSKSERDDPSLATRGWSRPRLDVVPKAGPALDLREQFGPEVAFARGSSRGVAWFALDTRQIRFALVPGARWPRASNTAVATPTQLDAAAIEAAWIVPSAHVAGGRWRGTSLSEGSVLDGPCLGLAPRLELTLSLGRACLEATRMPFALPLGASAGAGAHAVCVTRRGLLVVLGSGSRVDEVLLDELDCEAAAIGAGRPADLAVGEAARSLVAQPPSSPVLVALRASASEVIVPDERHEWEVLEAAGSEPEWLPSAFVVDTVELGVSVRIHRLDAARYDWALVAGTDERAHRFGGQFPEQLGAADAGRARFAVSMATGKRRSPRGLRIGGSTGLAFRGGAALLGLSDEGLVIDGSAPPRQDDFEHATELPWTIESGAPSATARQRGPRLPKGDLCIDGSGRVHVAVSDFDSHEANARALVKAGCDRAVALDRGTERAAWVEAGTAAGGPFESTALVALERPMKGAARSEP